MSEGETHVASPTVEPSDSTPADRRSMKRWLMIVTVLLAVGLLAYWYRSDDTTLSAEEARLVGTWEWKNPTVPPKPGEPPQVVTFTADKHFKYPQTSVHESNHEAKWKIVNGRLKITHYYTMTLYRNGPVMPMKKSEWAKWRIVPTADSNRIDLKEGTQTHGVALSDTILVRAKSAGGNSP